MLRPPLVTLLAVAGVALASLSGCAADAPDGGRASAAPAPAVGPAPFRRAGVAAHLRELQRIAREHDGTRAAGTAGERATVGYLVERLRAAGYDVRRQRVRFPYFETIGGPRVAVAGTPLRGARGGIRAVQYTPVGDVTGRLRRIGTACSPSQGARLRPGEIALASRGACTFRAKALNAAASGAGALLIAGRAGEPVIAATLGRPGITIPVLFLDDGAAGRLRDGEPVSVRVRAISEMRAGDNVLAAASEPARRSAMVGAHLDSVPRSPGLNDNGSGVAAVLDIAERLASEGAPPAGIRYGFWTAEELGLIGSRHYVGRLDAAGRRAIAAYLNLDMVGSPRPRPIAYAAGRDRTERRLERLLRAGLRREGLAPRSRRVAGRSDHSPFARAGIPVGGLFTGAGRPADPCYHRSCDDLSNVDGQTTQALANVARRALARLARGF
jgi:hypothetical protein